MVRLEDRSLALRRLALAGALCALGVVMSPLSFPVGPAKCYPFQHALNVVAGYFLGPWYGAGCALVTSLIRISLGTGTLFALPGSIPGALLAGLAARAIRGHLVPALGEVMGTCLVGAYLASALVGPMMGRSVSFQFLLSAFAISSVPGAALGALAVRLSHGRVLGLVGGRLSDNLK
ncbi:energy coupling factor transporter S component ThiW [Thermanaerovibrio acidaminovorans]|uniref:energy coupling factor transporter S component ThiW n=1 Tax=Thermanaerovibrio acidaminovorans TaxID=81462 RepID=UPI002490D64D|nr:energy coupling factor transporter S component ThiW [Thermanaerovibrio acidaminovorans]